MSTGRTEREGERPNQSRFVRQSPTDKSRTNSSRSERSRSVRVIRLFTYFRVVIGRLPPLTLSPILSLSCGEKAALRSSPASLSPWHVFPPRRRCRCFLLRFQSFIPSPVVCPSAHFNINYRVVDGYVYVQESDTVRRRWRRRQT